MVGRDLIGRSPRAVRSGRLAAAVALGLLCAASPALGADAPIAAPPPVLVEVPPPSWTFRFTPYAWLASIRGSQTVRGRTVEVNETFLDIVHDTLGKGNQLFAVMAHFEARNGPIAFFADGIRSSWRSPAAASGRAA